jgi:hypothetical protein
MTCCRFLNATVDTSSKWAIVHVLSSFMHTYTHNVTVRIDLVDAAGDIVRIVGNFPTTSSGLASKLQEMFKVQKFVAISKLSQPQTKNLSCSMYEWVVTDKKTMPEVRVLPHPDIPSSVPFTFDVAVKPTYAVDVRLAARVNEGKYASCLCSFVPFYTLSNNTVLDRRHFMTQGREGTPPSLQLCFLPETNPIPVPAPLISTHS